MKNLLTEISLIAIQQNESAFTEEQKKSRWLGTQPALEEEIKAAESRLGVNLPDDYKDLLSITNGFFTPCDSTEPTFEPVTKIDYLKNIDTYLLEIWNEGVLADIGEQLNRAIVVGGLVDEQYFFLITPEHSEDKWQYWKFANWLCGEQRYENLENYFVSVLAFLKN